MSEAAFSADALPERGSLCFDCGYQAAPEIDTCRGCVAFRENERSDAFEAAREVRMRSAERTRF